jgi:hypothetical protein
MATRLAAGRPRHLATALAAIVATGSLAACGGNDVSVAERQLRADVTEGLTSTDPDTCTRYATQRFVEQLSGERGDAALDSCRADAKNTDFTSVDFERVAISGARASVTVRPHGGDKELTAPPDALSGPAADCVLGELESTEDGEIIRSLVAADPQPIVVALATCSTRTPPPSGSSPESSASRVS